MGWTHKDWYAIPTWEQALWLSRELHRMKEIQRIFDSIAKLKAPEKIPALIYLQAEMI